MSSWEGLPEQKEPPCEEVVTSFLEISAFFAWESPDLPESGNCADVHQAGCTTLYHSWCDTFLLYL